jgi:hypothetical protein
MKRMKWHNVGFMALFVGGFLFCTPTVSRAQATRDYEQDFGAVSAWNLNFTVTRSGSGSHAIGNFGDTYTWSISETITGSITLTNCQLSGCVCTPSPAKTSCDGTTAVVNTSISDSISNPRGSIPLQIQHLASGSYVPKFASIAYDFTTNQYFVIVDSIQPSGQVLGDGAVIQTGLEWNCGNGFQSTFPATGLNLTTVVNTPGSPCGFELPDTIDNTAGTIQFSVALTPTSDNDLIISIPQYSTWRPTGGLTEKEDGVGDPLIIQASLIRKSTGLLAPVGPEKITFSLAEVSHEKGVAMNWPVTGGTTDPDLTFEAQACVDQQCIPINQGFKISDPATAEYDQPFSISQIQLTSHDWGGTATLHVDAEINGVTLHGHLQNDDGTDILLPQRQPDSMIADSWKNGHGIALDTPDSDDSENDPVGNGKTGDGFTLYEEYRGFYMGCASGRFEPAPEGTGAAFCQRAEGDPKKKDLFVEEETTADSGILQFQADSGLNVHYSGLQLTDFGPKGPMYRVMNLNHTNGAHQVDEHALIIQLGPSTGASRGINIDSISCPGSAVHSCRPSLPGEMDHIEMAYKTSEGLSALNSRWVSDVAHEISHAVNVYHHGDIDHTVFWSIDPNSGGVVEQNLSGDSPFGTPTPIRVVTEATLKSGIPVVLSSLQLTRVPANNPKDSQGNPIAGRLVYLGNAICGGAVTLHGQSSGDVQSIMRYDVAEAYIPAGLPGIRVWVAGSEQLGFDLTDHPGGTEVNDPGRTIGVGPRYGDAFGGRGNDLSQMDVNDSHSAQTKAAQPCS